MFGFFKKVIGLVAFVLVAYAGFRWGPLVFPTVERALGMHGAPASPEEIESVPSAEIADRTLERFERFRKGGEGEGRMALSGLELSSVVRYALPGIVPVGVAEPRVELSDGRVRLVASVALGAFPRLPKLDEVLGILPDTVTVQLEGSLVPLDRGRLALLVDYIEVARIPLPRRMIPRVLEGLGRGGDTGSPEDALAVPMPDGLQSVYVQRDSLVLIAKR